ncbi:serine/threonine-protein kinase [Deinococcus aetherius]
MPLAGQMVGEGVRLVRPLGRGSHSVVYFAVGPQGQACAVKIFEAAYTQHAVREYRHASGLDHPRLVRVLAATQVEDRPALVMTLARGVTLFERYLRRPALTCDRRTFLLTLAHVLGALDHLHTRGLVHRDLKPENVLVEQGGGATVVDLDLSGPVREVFPVPTRVGTAAFQSPEAARGEPLGPESDLYGVGVLLGWGLTGELPEPGAPVLFGPDPLAPLYAALTDPDRARRPASAHAVRETLLGLSGLPY